MSQLAKQIIQRHFVADHALGFEPEIESSNKWSVVRSYKEQGVNHLSLSLATDMTSMSNTMHHIASVRRYLMDHSGDYQIVSTYDDFKRASSSGKLAISFLFQGVAPIHKDLDMIDVYKQLGVMSMLLSYNIQNEIGSGCTEPHDAGLSRFGERVVQRMNAVGMLIDVSHAGEKTSLDILGASSKPVIFSHSNVNSIYQHPRNLTDQQILACARSGGFIGVNGNGPLLGDPQAPVEKLVDHIDYIVDLAGIDHVALGTDHVYFQDIFDQFMKKNAVIYPANYNVPEKHAWHSIAPNQLPEIVDELLKRNYQETDIAKIIGGNSMRVYQSLFS